MHSIHQEVHVSVVSFDCSLKHRLSLHCYTTRGRDTNHLQALPAHVGEVQVLVRLYVELLPEQVGKVQDPLVDLKRLVGLLGSRGSLCLLQQPYKTRSNVSLTCSSKKDKLKIVWLMQGEGSGPPRVANRVKNAV